MADFISTRLVDQLRLKKRMLEKPLNLQLAISGSKSKVNCEVITKFQYQNIDTDRRFDVANLDSYDLILGTPFIYQHKVLYGLNPGRIAIGSKEPVPIEGKGINTILAMSTEIEECKIDTLREQLKVEAEDL